MGAMARPALARPVALWQGSARLAGPLEADSRVGACCRSSVVEHSIGNGEVDSSILSGSTSPPTLETPFFITLSELLALRCRPVSIDQIGYFSQNRP